MKKIIFATGNADKMKEIRKILADLDAEVVSMKEAGIQADIVEDGKTFEENAVIKATAISKLTSDGIKSREFILLVIWARIQTIILRMQI